MTEYEKAYQAYTLSCKAIHATKTYAEYVRAIDEADKALWLMQSSHNERKFFAQFNDLPYQSREQDTRD